MKFGYREIGSHFSISIGANGYNFCVQKLIILEERGMLLGGEGEIGGPIFRYQGAISSGA
jgi:hypothetical protein